MSNVIDLRDYYEAERNSLLEQYKHCTSLDGRLRLSNAMSKLEQRWLGIHKMYAKQLFNKAVSL